MIPRMPRRACFTVHQWVHLLSRGYALHFHAGTQGQA